MFAYGLIITEIVFFTLVIAYVFRKNAPEYKVSKDIWGVYQQPTQQSGQQAKKLPESNDQSMVIVFSKNSTSVKVESQNNPFDPDGPKGSPSHFKKAA
jgi:uncharacterized membrane protein